MNQSKPESSSAIIIIGSGLAGYTLVREIRKIDKAIPITLITREPGYFYSKPMLSTAFASKKEAAQLISTATEAMATQLEISILPQTDVSAIDATQKLVTSNKGEIAYDKLVLALGADQIRVPLQGNAAHEVMTVNDLEEYAQIGRAHV